MERSWKCMKVYFHKQLAWSGSVWKPGVSYEDNLQIYWFSIPFWALALSGVVACWKADGISSFVFLAFTITRKGCSTENVYLIPNQSCWCPERHEEQHNPHSLKWSHTEHSAPTTTSFQSSSRGKHPSLPISPHRCHFELGHWKPISCKRCLGHFQNWAQKWKYHFFLVPSADMK